MKRNDEARSHTSMLDARARTAVDRLHARAKAQRGAVIRHHLLQLPGFMFGRPLVLPKDKRFFE